jgi:hypothetical protein
MAQFVKINGCAFLLHIVLFKSFERMECLSAVAFLSAVALAKEEAKVEVQNF